MNRDIERPLAASHPHYFLVDNRMVADDNAYLGGYNELADAGGEILTDTGVMDIMDDGITMADKGNRKSTLEADAT